MRVHNISNPFPMEKTVIRTVKSEQKPDFQKMLRDSLHKVSQTESISNAYAQMVATGEIDNIHEAEIAAQKAEITLNFALQVRKGVLEAYQELMRLQV